MPSSFSARSVAREGGVVHSAASWNGTPVELGGGVLNGLDDVLVAGAAADVAADAEADLVLGRLRVLLQQPVRADDHPGRAEAALQAVHLAEAFLQGRCSVPSGVGHALDGGDRRRPSACTANTGAGLHRHAVDVDGAGAAMGGLAADMGAGEAADSRGGSGSAACAARPAPSTCAVHLQAIRWVLAMVPLPQPLARGGALRARGTSMTPPPCCAVFGRPAGVGGGRR